jgi:predicted negative regulator of RcsB-dependent stress response
VDELSENEQLEAVKAWLRSNGPSIIGGLALGVLLVVGWRWWQGREQTNSLAANAAYEQLLQTFTPDAKPEDVESRLATFKATHARSAYAMPAELAVAAVLVDRNELDKAAAHLRTVIESAKDEALREVARVRLARVLVSQDKADEALALLEQGKAEGYEAAYAEARGDALFAKGDRAGALKQYQDAKAAAAPLPSAALGRTALDLKINDLSAEAAQ